MASKNIRDFQVVIRYKDEKNIERDVLAEARRFVFFQVMERLKQGQEKIK
ncbi:MAG: hypothetical protein K9L17_11580 [Clostridiales bacterium]|nr:hypothetical protein [Clostridiales bacterium]MCF8023323.1 hypothetical protein [Clostridiales bacterium]